MKRILMVFVVAAMVAITSQIQAAQEQPSKAPKSKAQQILDQVKQNMDSLDDYQVTIEENSVVYGPKGKKTANGITKMTVKKDKRYVEQETDRDGVQQKIIQVFDGRRSWIYDQRTKLARKVELNNISKELRDKFKAMMMKQNINLPEADYKLSEKTVDGKNYYLLESQKKLTIGNQVFDKIRITIERVNEGRGTRDEGRGTRDERRRTRDEGRGTNKDNNDEVLLLCKQEVTARLVVNIPGAKQPFEIKTETTQEFKDWKFNTGIKDYEFTIALPADAQILDQTENTRMMLEKMIEGGNSK